jgi:hypothetical protein
MAYYDLESSAPPTRQDHDATPRVMSAHEYQKTLIELTTHPICRYCFSILTHGVLSNDIVTDIEGLQPSRKFNIHIQTHYKPFLRDCVEYMYTYGFIPYTITKTKEGHKIPCILPHGTFTWHTETFGQQDQHIEYTGNGICQYHIHINRDCKKKINKLYVLEVETPRIQPHIPFFTPMYQSVKIYKLLTLATERANKMDRWNTSAHIFATYKPTPMATAVDPDRSLMDFVNPELASILTPPNHAVRDNIIRSHIFDNENDHKPNIYTLPVDHTLEQLRPLQNTNMVNDYYNHLKSSISNTLNIPAFIMDFSSSPNKHFDTSNSRVQGNSSTTKTTCRTFFITLQNIATKLEAIARHAYGKCYKCDETEVNFTIDPEHWLHVESIDDVIQMYTAQLLDEAQTKKLTNQILRQTSEQVDKERVYKKKKIKNDD